MGFVTSNMIDLNSPLTQIFTGLLLAITGCVILIQSPDLDRIAFVLYLVAGILVALAIMTLFRD